MFGSLDDETLCVQAEVLGEHTRRSRVGIFANGVWHDVPCAGNSWIQGIHDRLLIISAHHEGVEECSLFDWKEERSMVVASGNSIGKPVFARDGTIRFFINRSHHGPQTVRNASLKVIHTTAPNCVLLDVDSSAACRILEARYEEETNRWLPWVIEKSRYQNSEICVLPECPGSIKHFRYGDDFRFFSVRKNDGSTEYNCEERSGWGAGVKQVIDRYLTDKEVISGPEVETLRNIREWDLVVADTPPIITIKDLKS